MGPELLSHIKRSQDFKVGEEEKVFLQPKAQGWGSSCLWAPGALLVSVPRWHSQEAEVWAPGEQRPLVLPLPFHYSSANCGKWGF